MNSTEELKKLYDSVQEKGIVEILYGLYLLSRNYLIKEQKYWAADGSYTAFGDFSISEVWLAPDGSEELIPIKNFEELINNEVFKKFAEGERLWEVKNGK